MASIIDDRVIDRMVLNGLHRMVSCVRVGSVEFGDLRRVRPTSRNFGFDRGKPLPLDRRYID